MLESLQKHKKIIKVVSVLLIVAFIMGSISFEIAKRRACREGKKPLTFSRWFNGKVSLESIAVGMMSGMVFGFIDNAGLFYGMEALDQYMEKLPNGCYRNVQSGYGNAFADAFSSILSVFAGKMIVDATGSSADDTPLWSQTLGIIIGCLLGVFIPYSLGASNGDKVPGCGV
jgi:hypothetical protein